MTTNVERENMNTPPGPGVDSSGQAVLDPTKNVLDLVEAAIRRINDLNDLQRGHDTRLYNMLEARLDREGSHLNQLRQAEADRLDSIRAVDIAAVQQAAQVSATQASTLAAQVATSADTLRNQVAAAATASTVALAAALDPIQKDIADLRRAQYEQQGQKSQVIEGQATAYGSRQSTGLYIAAAAVTMSFIVGAIGIIVTIMMQQP